jgi:hypothetical protein
MVSSLIQVKTLRLCKSSAGWIPQLLGTALRCTQPKSPVLVNLWYFKWLILCRLGYCHLVLTFIRGSSRERAY